MADLCGDNDSDNDFRLVGCYVVHFGKMVRKLRRNVLHLSSGLNCIHLKIGEK